VPCKLGLHASKHPFDALQFAPGNILHRVSLCGYLVPHGDPVDQFVGRRRKILPNHRHDGVVARVRAMVRAAGHRPVGLSADRPRVPGDRTRGDPGGGTGGGMGGGTGDGTGGRHGRQARATEWRRARAAARATALAAARRAGWAAGWAAQEAQRRKFRAMVRRGVPKAEKRKYDRLPLYWGYSSRRTAHPADWRMADSRWRNRALQIGASCVEAPVRRAAIRTREHPPPRLAVRLFGAPR